MTKHENMLLIVCTQTSQTAGQPYSDSSPTCCNTNIDVLCPLVAIKIPVVNYLPTHLVCTQKLKHSLFLFNTTCTYLTILLTFDFWEINAMAQCDQIWQILAILAIFWLYFVIFICHCAWPNLWVAPWSHCNGINYCWKPC